jgi:hypothetical protein
MKKLLVAAVALAALLLVPAASASDCWKGLLRDYADDGRIEQTYPAVCYRDAIRQMPITLKAYSDAYDVLTRALAAATAHPRRRDGVLLVPPPKLPPPAPGQDERRPGHPAPFTRAANSFSSSEPDRVPLPLLVLGGLGVLFVAAGVAGAIVRRRRSG